MKVTLDDMSACFGTSDFDNEFIDLFNKYDWEYEQLDLEQQMSEVLGQLQYSRLDKQRVGTIGRTEVWDRGWDENLQEFLKSGDPKSLVPKYYFRGEFIRFNKKFIRHKCRLFELNFVRLLQNFVFRKYFTKYDNIYEFGCGSGMNTFALHEMFPNKKLYGCDFVQPSVDIVDAIHDKLKAKAEGVLFDMSNPSYDFKIAPNSCVFTMGAVEQIPFGFRKFIDYLVHNKVELCCHIEPCIELYDDNNIVDMTAILFYEKRGYTVGLLPYLIDLEKDGKISIINKKRTLVGSQRMEGYNLIVWKCNFQK